MDRIEPELILKTTPPRGQKTAQVRNRLSIDTAELAEKVVIAVQAPAGFGKTFLLTQWRRESLSHGAVVAWLTLDGQDDGDRFVQGLAAAMAIGSGRSSFAHTFERLSAKGSDELEGLTQWLAEVADLGSETLLILDEVDTLPDVTVRHSLAYLLHNAPANLRVIMASRGRLNLQVSDLMASGRYALITTPALRLSVEETVAILNGRFGARIDTDLCVRLHEITEGWPLGLQLAISAMEKSPNLRTAIEELSTCSGDIQRYFVDSLIAHLPDEQVRFLISMAFLEMVQPTLCVAVTGSPSAVELLKELCVSTPIFVEGVDSDWVRFHPLAREFLHGRFASLPLERRQGFHERAAVWLEQHGFLEQAARQYLLAGLSKPAFIMIEACLYDVMLGGKFSRVLEWVEELADEDVLSHPRICLASAWALAMGERQAEAAKLVASIEQHPSADEATRCEAAAIATAAAYFADRPDESLALITPWVDRLPSFSIKLQAIVANQIARLALFQGQPEKARRIFQRAPHYAWTPGLDAIRGFGEWVVGLTYLCEGRMVPAEAALRDSLLRAERDIGRRSPMTVMLACSMATVLLERGDLQQASTVLANRLDMVERLASPHAIVLGFVTAARLATLQGQGYRGQDILEALFALGEERSIPRFCIASLGEQIRLHALQGRVDTCSALWRRLDAVVPLFARENQGLLGPELALLVGLANTYLMLVKRDWPAMLQVLDRVSETAEHLRRGREVVQIKLLRTLALDALGEDSTTFLLEAVSLAQEYGLQRVVQDTHPDLVKRVQKLQLQTTLSETSSSAPIAPATRTESATSSVSPSRLLTPKEREVLQLLARNLSNKQIALALNVGEETVKWHLKNLFGKFQAGTRKHVVARAYMLGILETAG
ncbi:LuxR family transcriptional regulator [Pseudomonas sp. TH39(2020)]|uniref:helix-turn-helix transcriptional regulator n=1 Tax=Pseudomonas sp. TH39(2020) TaxID=2796349 RepID=UPI00191179E6|nr:LuxR C-terminal-related transcriptional regulator [Pseudomonas sp. TH39(2020)]MBK5396379.1 LuxR family transcriptional regulator [Pseudomonas sp. TH39(2020)]